LDFTRYRSQRLSKSACQTGFSQSRWLCENFGLTPAAPCIKSWASAAEKRDLGCGWSAAPTNHTPNPILSIYFVKTVACQIMIQKNPQVLARPSSKATTKIFRGYLQKYLRSAGSSGFGTELLQRIYNRLSMA
jgi:hypothetical protein